MDIPTNCLECKYATDCYSYYGGGMCKYKDPINRQLISKPISGKSKN